MSSTVGTTALAKAKGAKPGLITAVEAGFQTLDVARGDRESLETVQRARPVHDLCRLRVVRTVRREDR